MSATPRLWPVIIIFVVFGILTLGVALIEHNLWLTLALATVAFGFATLGALRYMKTVGNLAVMSRLGESQAPAENHLAYRLLSDLAAGGADRKSANLRAAEIISRNLMLDRFVVLFRDNDKYLPKIYCGFSRNDLKSPSAHLLSNELKRDIQRGAISSDEDDIGLACRFNGTENMGSPVTFAYSWARSKSVLVVADDLRGYFTEMVKNADFNEIFWPGLENIIRSNQRLQEKTLEARESSQMLEQARKDISELNKELKNKLVDLQSFVRISGDLYSLFNEEQLFQTLKELVCNHLGAGSAEVMVPDGEGRYVLEASARPADGPGLALNDESELRALLTRSARPVLLPLAGTGLKSDEPFLGAAIRAGFQVASAIKTNDQTAFILLLAEKRDKSQYSNLDLDFLSVISNIASLSMENIHQYSTIEKLSYTDSMTGVFNYRYFYKRLSEEILRAKRYERELALVILDIDNFKLFNDNYGHQAGDEVLKQLSELITRTIRSIDVVSRYGGEEFCIIMPDTGIANCTVFIERLRFQIAEHKFESRLFERGSSISVSVGGAVFPPHAPTPDRIIYCADMALLRAKSLGRNRSVMYKSDLSLETKTMEGGFDESRQESIF